MSQFYWDSAGLCNDTMAAPHYWSQHNVNTSDTTMKNEVVVVCPVEMTTSPAIAANKVEKGIPLVTPMGIPLVTPVTSSPATAPIPNQQNEFSTAPAAIISSSAIEVTSSTQPAREQQSIKESQSSGPRNPPESGAHPTKENNEQSVVLSTSAEHSTDSAALEDSISERPPGKHNDSKNVRDRYRIIRQQYPEVVKRLDRLKMETRGLDWRSVQRAESLEVGESSHPVTSNRAQKNPSAPLDFDANPSANLKNVEPTLDSRSFKMNHSYAIPERMGSEDSSMKNDVYYGEDFVNSLRRSRHVRAREFDHFPSRGTKSEMGEVGPYRGPALALHKQFMMQHAYGYNSSAGYQPSEYYPSGRQSLGPYLGRRTAQELAMIYNDDTSLRRPQSSFDASAYAKHQRLNEFVQDNHQKDRVEQSSENEDESSGSDSEIARIHYEQEMARRAVAMHYNAVPIAAPNEFYYFGVIQLPQERVEHIMRRMPPPPEYFQLPPIEKAAYLFYCVLYQHHYHPIDLFHKKFNREYFNYMCEGDSAEIALWKICKHTQEEFIAKRSANHLKAYEMSQKQLFSDDRETLDSRQSERGSRCDPEDESDQLSIDSTAREPLKFRVAHSFLEFGVGGKVIVLNVQNSENILEIRDLKTLIDDRKLLHISNAIDSFRGPLIGGFTPAHSVRLYVQRQIELILKSEAYRSDPSSSMANDCLLVWQLLEMLVQQQGRVTGPDLSRLLMTGCNAAEHRRNVKEKTNSPSPANFNERTVDPKGYDRFTQLLLGGHVKEALDSAVKDGLYSDAMILARRICANEPQELEKIEATFLSHRSELNPVMTLLSVASGQPVPVLTSPPMDDGTSWRTHAAIVLANLKTPAALGTVYQLGRVLARRELHAAADFCFLAVSLLMPGYNPFQPVLERGDESTDVRQHITLIHATSADDEQNNFACSEGFSITDLHATEIFEYATKLASGGIPVNLSKSLAYQLCRLSYAEMVSEFGSAADAFRYCVEIARGIWDRRYEIDVEQLDRLYELAERLKFMVSADASSTSWLIAIRSLIDERRKVVEENNIKQDASTPVMDQDVEDVGLMMKVSPGAEVAGDLAVNTSSRNEGTANTKLLGSEAVEWHAGHQEPITITSAPIQEQTMENQKPESNEYRMQPGQLHERVRTHSSTSASAHTSQYSTVPPSPPVSMKDYTESSMTRTASPMLPQESERISRDSIHGYYDDSSYERKGLMMEQRTDLKCAGCDVPTEVTTDGNTTATSSHESTPHRKIFHSEGKVPDGMVPVMAPEGQAEEMLQSKHVPSVTMHSGPSQHQNYLSERSHALQRYPNMVKKDAKTHGKGKVVGEHRHNSGLFSKLKATIAKAIPSSNEMILPDDKNPSIVWDPKLNRYVGEGIEEESLPAPPPSVTPSSEKLNGSAHGSVSGLTAARLSGGSRYFNPLIETAPSRPTAQTVPLLPPVPYAATFGFIPSMPDTDDVSVESPFSVDTNPQSQETEVAE